jgi:hypothetical protein
MVLAASFLLYGLLGIVGAAIASAVRRSIADRRMTLTGEASLILFPLCGLIAILFPIVAVHVSHLAWYARGAAYMAAFYTVQLILGFLLARVGACPWHYEGRWALAGVVRLSDAPLWFAAGLAIERLHPWVKAAAVALG